MSSIAATAETQAQTLFAALIPCEGVGLLLPNALVAATLTLDALTPPQAAPEWLIGSVKVLGSRVPVIRFELLSGAANSSFEVSATHRKNRIVVLRAAGLEPAFAVLAGSAPRLLNVNPTVLKPMPLLGTDAEPYCMTRVRLGHTDLIIPNVDALAAAARSW